jgi:hypothetical protein
MDFLLEERMKPTARLVVMLLTLTPLAACDDARTQPVSASPLPSAPSPAPTAGQITLRSIAPGSGAILNVLECPTSLTSNFKDLCTEPLQMTVDVEFNGSVSDAVTTAGFYSGTKRCGLATSESSRFATDNRASFDLRGAIELSDESVQLHCPLPAETTRMVIQLWERGRPGVPLLTQEFAHHYTFTQP